MCCDPRGICDYWVQIQSSSVGAPMFVCPNISSTLAFSASYKLCILVTVVALEGKLYMQSLDAMQIISSKPSSSTMLIGLQAVATYWAIAV